MPIVRVVDDDLTERVTEWVVLQVLMHHRRQRLYDRFQRERRWKELAQPAAHQVGVGIMGMGVIGQAAAAALRQLGFRVAGWSRQRESGGRRRDVRRAANWTPFWRGRTSSSSLLPLTAETRGILAMPLFRKLVERRTGRPAGGDQCRPRRAAGGGRHRRGARRPYPRRRQPRRVRAGTARSGEPALGLRHCGDHAALRRLQFAGGAGLAILRQIEAFEAGKPLANWSTASAAT